MKIKDIEPFLRYANIQPYINVEGVDYKAYDYRLFYILSGEGNFCCGEETLSLEKGHLIIVPPSFPYSFNSSKTLSSAVFNFDMNEVKKEVNVPQKPSIAENFAVKEIINEAVVSPFDKCVIINASSQEELILNILAEFKSGGVYSLEKSSALMKVLLLNVAENVSLEDVKGDKLYYQIMNFINLHFNEKIVIEDIAKALNYHPVYLNRVFKEKTGKPIHKYVNEERLLLAEKLLLKTDLTVEEIAEKCGFVSQSHLSSSLKKFRGKSPTELKR